MTSEVEHPKHYTSHPSGIECIQVTEHMDFLTGNIIKYVWRAGLKKDKLEDLKKARWYLERLIVREENKHTEDREDRSMPLAASKRLQMDYWAPGAY